ncbi:HAD family phosphatase [Sphaerisporangium sp. B11E5]|uniref:HAD family hydrolase n=1 Tax=Sphaerisporangium sp. B11E5 TaxID=3153563 RepID=UPI00325D0530
MVTALSVADHRLVVLDIDGTLLDTPHLAAWRKALAEVTGAGVERLTAAGYQRLIAGRSRSAGARAALEVAGVPPTDELVDRLAAVKQDIFQSMAESTVLFPDARRFLAEAAERAVPLAFCTASRNAGALLRTHLPGPRAEWLSGRLDHSLASAGRHPGATRSEALVRVARAWNTSPLDCLLLDDSPHGVLAGARCGMRSVLVDRSEDGDGGHDFTWRVTSLDEIALGAAHAHGLEER